MAVSGLKEEIVQAAADGQYEEVVRLARMMDEQDRRDLLVVTERFVRALRQANEEEL
jgi:hypothetical protein